MISKDDNSVIQEKGKVYYLNGKWRWDYFGEERRSYIIKGDKVYQISEDGKEEININKEDFNNSILNVLKKPFEFLRKRKNTSIGDKIIIYGKEDEKFSRVIIDFKKGEIEKITVFDPDENIIEFKIQNINFKPKFSEKIFNITKLE